MIPTSPVWLIIDESLNQLSTEGPNITPNSIYPTNNDCRVHKARVERRAAPEKIKNREKTKVAFCIIMT